MAAEFTGVQPLPARPGAMAAQQVRPKGQVTAGRPLPPRATDTPPAQITAAAEPTAPFVAPVAVPVVAPPAAPAPVAVARAARPDPRPMRLAFGAGAMAAVGALTIGMVRPDFTGSANEAPSGQPADQQASTASDADIRVRRVTNYVLLEPGEKAPKGATVISAEELLGLGNETVRPDRQRADQPDRSRATRPDRQPAAQPDRQPAPQAERAPQPQPDPPRVTTRQSGS